MVIAYFIKEHGMHYEEAYRLVKAKRKIVGVPLCRSTLMMGSSAS
jgi:hypothetical protein